MLAESNAFIKLEGSAISFDHSQVQGANPEFSGGVFQKSHCPPPPAAATTCLDEIKFVDEGIAAEPFEAVAETEDCVPDWRVTIENDPAASEVEIFEEWDQSRAGLLAIETVAVEDIVVLHEIEKEFSVGGICNTKLWTVSHDSHRVFQRDCHTHAATDAECRHTFSGVSLQHLMQQSHRNPGSGAADRVT